jgi:hypothetical protein
MRRSIFFAASLMSIAACTPTPANPPTPATTTLTPIVLPAPTASATPSAEEIPSATPSTTASTSPPGDGVVHFFVDCAFRDGWVSLLPADKYPKDDSYLMEELVGITQDPKFWRTVPEAEGLKPYAAKRCSAGGAQFDVAPGDYFVLAGQADTFNSRGAYKDNGLRERIHLDAGHSSRSIAASDLTFTWNCISCPWISIFDFESGEWTRSFVTLVNRRAASLRGTDVKDLGSVYAHGDVVRVRVYENEEETTHLDELVLDVGGVRIAPAREARLARADAQDIVLDHGQSIVVDFIVPGAGDGAVHASLVAHGHYIPYATASSVAP